MRFEDNSVLINAFRATRLQSVQMVEPLHSEDFSLQAAAFASPPKWHLAHTSWFFETFILKVFVQQYQVFHPRYEVLFNSYYNAVGEQFPRPKRGLLSRPTIDEVLAYRAYIDQAMERLLLQFDHPERLAIIGRCRLGIQHEKQHQELFCTDLKYSFAQNPLSPVYLDLPITEQAYRHPQSWLSFQGGLVDIGVPEAAAESDEGAFSFDNESPQHQVYLPPFQLSDRLVTNEEYQAFIDDGGYRRAELWLADGWSKVQQGEITKPLYWQDDGDVAQEYTLYGLRPRQANQPVCHLSAYEAEAYAGWAGARLPTEFEWEYAATQQRFSSAAERFYHPQAVSAEAGAENITQRKSGQGALLQLYDACWQWTSSAYRPYPGFKVCAGAIGEYNGKFMCNQWVLRGGSCVSPNAHLRPSYRNFFYPEDRWQFSGLRLAKTII
ncbi:ergothioneine biosynthesis protein EgtB [Sinobacterium caligoides]|uniref:Ergothioneine biosynthesis protein EgtB n=1 Tax=Sinobacterium caligoides TaxID=933926 RepID=A0A3N2E0J5_9GAMM|nr:ergothioneine biosynthesis protein EgtB [Sinobacterium caligoides]ROS05547.1 ergothioneine biosynthesis protein EgtB [Sinobacterium caligoides]